MHFRFSKLPSSSKYIGFLGLALILAITTHHSTLYEGNRRLSSSPFADVLSAVTAHSGNFPPENVEAIISDPTHFFYLVRSEKPFFLAVTPKTGSSLFKMLATYVNGGPNMFVDTVSQDDPDKKNLEGKLQYMVHDRNKWIERNNIRNLGKANARKLLSSLPRVVITRNPYIRHHSAWKDLNRRSENKKPMSFENFTSKVMLGDVYAFRRDGYHAIPTHHIDSVTKNSKFELYGYNYVLRLEEMGLWFDSFVRDFGLESTMKELKKQGVDFFIPDVQAESSTIAEKEMKIFGKDAWSGIRPETQHENHSENTFFDDYTPKIARMVFDKFREDFEHFSYPAWDGNRETFHYV